MQQMQNRVTLVGNLGTDVQITSLSTGKKVAHATMATNEYYRNKEGERVSTTQWHRIVGWGPKAESMEKYLAKGAFVIIYGRLTHRSYEDNDGNTKYISEVLVNSFEALQKKAA